MDGAQYRYVMSGKEDGETLVLLNGGMNTLEMWMDYVDPLSADFRVLLFDYPQELRTNQALVTGMHAFFAKLGVGRPVFVGASDGGMVSQIYVQKYPGETGGLIPISTGGMDAATLKTLKKKYFFAPLMLWYMKHCNYEKLKPTRIKAGMSHIRNESAEEIAYAQDMFKTIFKDFQQEKDVHISGPARRSHEPEAGNGSGFCRSQRPHPSHSSRSGFFLRKNAAGSYRADARAADRLCVRRPSLHSFEGRRLHPCNSHLPAPGGQISPPGLSAENGWISETIKVLRYTAKI